MERFALAAGLALVALAVAALLQQRRRPDAPTRTGYGVPSQLDRHDFADPEVPWLVTVFTSATCQACQGVWERAVPLASPQVSVQQLEYVAQRALHDRYEIEAVPTTLVVDDEGVVVCSFVGPVTATDLWAAVAEAREPGSTPGGCEPPVR